MGGDSIFRSFGNATIVLDSETSRDLLLQHEPYSFGMGERVGHIGRTFQSGIAAFILCLAGSYKLFDFFYVNLGLLSQQYPRQQLRIRLAKATGYALLGEGRAANIQVPEGLLEAFPTHNGS